MTNLYKITGSKLRAALVLLLAAIPAGGAFAQNAPVTGVVSDSQTGEPIVGVTVMVGGTNAATITDMAGAFSVNAAQGATVMFSFLGYEDQQATVSGSVLNVKLARESFELDEVVVVGTVMRKSDLTGAVAGVSAKVLAEKPVTTVNQALQGRIAGVFITQGAKPTDNASIRIRGINTIDGSTDPIFVVDGVVMDSWKGGFSATNVSDIASVEVLKDASATALYGSRGSNGVVVITTKKGQNGEGKVTYDAWVGFQTFGYEPELMNTRQLYETRAQAYTNGYIQSFRNGNNGASPSQAQIDAYVASNIDKSEAVFTAAERTAYGSGSNYNWLDAILRNQAVQHNHVVSFSNGNENGSFYLSLGYMNNKGLIQKTEQNKYTGRINAEQRIKPWLKVGTNTSFTYTGDSKVDNIVFQMARSASPFLPVNDTDLRIGWRNADNNSHNPLRSLRIDDHERFNRMVSANYINIEPIKGLNIRSTLSVDHGTASYNRYVPNDISEAERDSHDGRATDNRDTRTVLQWDNSISYNTTWDVHRLTAMVGTNATSMKSNWINSRADGFAVNDFTYHNLGANMRKDTYQLSSDWNKQALMAYLARVSYSYDDRYLVTATARYDGSSKFAKGHRWGLFPSVSAAWNITEESFMADQNIFDHLKLRAGFGLVGNQNINDFMPYTIYVVGGSGTSETGYTPSSSLENERRGTPDITWEKQQQWNVGLDMGFLRDRITLSVDAYLIDNKDLLMSRSLSGITGYRRATENVGAIRNRGIELSLNAAILKTPDFEWNVSGSFSLDRNKVTRLAGGLSEIWNIDNDQRIQNEGNLIVGRSRNTYYMMRSAGIAQPEDMWYVHTLNLNGRQIAPGDFIPVDVNNDGIIDENGDRVVVGSKDPKFYGGFATDFTWKGLSLNAVFTYSYGAKRVGGWYDTLTGGYGNRMTSTDLLNNTWTPENTGAEFPRLLAENAGFNRWGQGSLDTSLWDASYLRLSALTLSYTIPARFTDRVGLSNLRVYTTGSNLLCFTPYKGYDPEFGDDYPATRMWTFGVNLSF